MKKFKKFSILIMYVLVLSMAVPSLIPVNNTALVKAATTVKISKSKLTLYVGKASPLKVTGTTNTVTWASSDKLVATVSNKGKVTAIKAGSAIITATVNNKEYTCNVTVSVKGQTTVYGKVTAVSGKKVTIALGTLNTPSGNPPSGNAPSGSTSSNAAPSGTPAAAPSGTPAVPSSISGSTSGSSSSSTSSSQPSGAPDFLTLTGKSATITISDTSILTKETMGGPGNQSSSTSSTASASSDASSSTASLSDISVGSILKVTYKNTVKNLVAIQIIGGGQGGQTQTGSGSSSSTGVTTGTGAYNLNSGDTISGGTYASTKDDENAIRADNSITASLTDVAVVKAAGVASSSDASSFYGLNAAILALGGATLNITGGSVTAETEGSNGVFAYDGATVNIKNTTVNVTGGNAGGIEVAGGGILNATNLAVYSKVKAAIRSDRGGGTMTVNGGTYSTSGSSGAPAVYSTANITVNDATLNANTSEAIVVEGLNSVTLNNCVVSGNMSGTYGSSSSENIHNVMLYQSMSGDAEVGNSSFTMTNGSLTSNNGDMFYVTNTDSVIDLTNVALSLAANTNLLVVAGNDASKGWGTVGSNGGNCTFTVSNQTLTGDITVDKISKLTMAINNSSTFNGSINSDGTVASTLSVTLDSTSAWTLTADSYVTEFIGSMSNVNLNGHTLYVNGVAKN